MLLIIQVTNKFNHKFKRNTFIRTLIIIVKVVNNDDEINNNSNCLIICYKML